MLTQEASTLLEHVLKVTTVLQNTKKEIKPAPQASTQSLCTDQESLAKKMHSALAKCAIKVFVKERARARIAIITSIATQDYTAKIDLAKTKKILGKTVAVMRSVLTQLDATKNLVKKKENVQNI